MYYWTCPDCGSNLDPGERCDCKSIAAVTANSIQDAISVLPGAVAFPAPGFSMAGKSFFGGSFLIESNGKSSEKTLVFHSNSRDAHLPISLVHTHTRRILSRPA